MGQESEASGVEKRSRGRPRSKAGAMEKRSLRVAAGEWRAWGVAADRDGFGDISSWLRYLANRAARLGL